MTRPVILLVDDEPAVLRGLSDLLHSLPVEIRTATSGAECLAQVRGSDPDLIVLDRMLPDGDGLDVLRSLRAFTAVPVLVLSVRDGDMDKVNGLVTGADDYVTKPYFPEEVVARIQALLRRQAWLEGTQAPPPYQRDGLTVDFSRNLALDSRGERILLTRTEWQLLAELARDPGTVITHDDLLERAWGNEFRGEVQYLRVWISRLRRKLSLATGRDDFIQTVAGLGYLFAQPDPAPARA